MDLFFVLLLYIYFCSCMGWKCFLSFFLMIRLEFAFSMSWLKRLTSFLALSGLAFKYVDNSIVRVRQGERTLVYDIFRGALDEPLGEGVHFLVPIIQEASIVNISMQNHEVELECHTGHLQKMKLETLSHPHLPTLPAQIRMAGHEYREKLIPIVGGRLVSDKFSGKDAKMIMKKFKDMSSTLHHDLKMGLFERHGFFWKTGIIESFSFTPSMEIVEFAKHEAEHLAKNLLNMARGWEVL